MYYRTVASYPKTISGFLLAFAVTAIGTLLWQHFFIKFALVGVIFVYLLHPLPRTARQALEHGPWHPARHLP